MFSVGNLSSQSKLVFALHVHSCGSKWAPTTSREGLLQPWFHGYVEREALKIIEEKQYLVRFGSSVVRYFSKKLILVLYQILGFAFAFNFPNQKCAIILPSD